MGNLARISGLGNLSQTVWLWTILALVCAVGAAAGFFT